MLCGRTRSGRSRTQGAGPGGKAEPRFSQSEIIEEGRGKIDIPIAYNEEIGEGTAVAGDLYTGKSAEASFSVK